MQIPFGVNRHNLLHVWYNMTEITPIYASSSEIQKGERFGRFLRCNMYDVVMITWYVLLKIVYVEERKCSYISTRIEAR